MKIDARASYLPFLIIVFAFVLTMAGVPRGLCYPLAGVDYLPYSSATLELEIFGPQGFNETIIAHGPTTIARGVPYDPGDGHYMISTQILSMNLVGTSMHVGPITIMQSPLNKSFGAIREVNAHVEFPADSFFDVFVAIQVPALSTTFYSDSTHMSATINNIPPWGATYMGPGNLTYLREENGTIIGGIVHVSHSVGMPYIGGFSVNIDYVHNRGLGSQAIVTSLISTIGIAATTTGIYVKLVKRKTTKKRQ